MNPCDYIIKGDAVACMDAVCTVHNDAAIAVSDGLILEVGAQAGIENKYKPEKVLGGKGRVIMPGLVNSHTHAPMVLMRGLADDMPLKTWLEEYIWPTENKWLSEEFVRDAARLACLEMIRSGSTTFCDMYFFEGVVAEVAEEMGLRAVLTAGIIDFPTHTTKGPDDCLEKALNNIEKFKGQELLAPGIGLHSPYTCSPDTIKKAVSMALEHDVLLSVHLSETEWEVGEVRERYGNTPAMHLDSLGYFEARTLNHHCVWLTSEEMVLMAEKGANVAHCPQSNLKLGSGIAPVPEMLNAGLNVCLGTDGAASNNDLDMLGELNAAALLHKGAWKDPTVVDSSTAISMATANGARALGLEGTGVIREGAEADLVLVDMRKPHLTPVYNTLSHLAYSVKSSDVETVMVKGRLLMEEGSVLGVDEQEIMDRAAHWGRKIRES
ncbi:amidohydrolase family protein [Nitrospirota bacterium]